MQIENEFNGFSMFDEVENVVLQAYNRSLMVFNIRSLHGQPLAGEYLDQFSDPDKARILALVLHIQKHGQAETHRMINNDDVKLVPRGEALMEEKSNAVIH